MQLLVDHTIEIKLYNFFITTNTVKPLRIMYGILYKTDTKLYKVFHVSFDEAGYSTNHVEYHHNGHQDLATCMSAYTLALLDGFKYLGLAPYYMGPNDFFNMGAPIWFDTKITNNTNRHFPKASAPPTPTSSTHSVAPVQGDWDL
jgi:hypothetical protein